MDEDKVKIACDLAVRQMAGTPSVSRVWLFGRAAKDANLDFRSDVDLAVEGLPAELHARFWSEIDSRSPIQIDLVRWEEASPTLRDEITSWGKVIYERPIGS